VSGLRVLVLFPEEYEIAHSNLGFHDIFRLFNNEQFVSADRAFFIAGQPPTHSFEKRIPVSEFDVIAVSLSFELQYYNFIRFLHRNKIPLKAVQRQKYHPFIIGGGPAITANPEPVADALDAAFIGEADELISDITSVFQNTRDREARKDALLNVDGVYIPQKQNHVKRVFVKKLDNIISESAIITINTEFGNSFLLEISRGCIRNCNFCLARNIYKPARFFSLEHIIKRLDFAKQYTNKAGLISTAVNNHPQIKSILRYAAENKIKLGLSSLDLRSLDEETLILLQKAGVKTITLAPESGSKRMLNLINKDFSMQHLETRIKQIAELNFENLKLYFIVGFPGEVESDLINTGEFINRVKQLFHRKLSISINPFVPKLHTPFANASATSPQYFKKAIKIIRERAGNIKISSYNPVLSNVQVALSRGNHDIFSIICEAVETGVGLKRAFKAHPLTMKYYENVQNWGQA